MENTIFISELKKGQVVEPEENVFTSIWNEYERVIVESLIASFALDFIVKDQDGGDVDTVHNVRAMKGDTDLKYKSEMNKSDYQNKGEYSSSKYHQDKRYIEINRKVSESKKNGSLRDSYTEKKVARNADIDLDHVIAAKEIHNDPGRVLAGLSGTDLANCEDNLKPTDRSINRSMQDKEINEYLVKLEQERPERQSRIKQLKNQKSLTEKERQELNKLEKLEQIDPDKMRTENIKARKAYNSKINREYYTSKKFAVDTARAASTRGLQMGARQAMGFIFAEIWFTTKDELKGMKPGCELSELFEKIGKGIEKGVESAKVKYKEIIAKFIDGFGAGVLSSLTTTICNIFFTTSKNLVRNIRQIYASVIQASKVILFNPDNYLIGDRIKTSTVIIATGASVLVGTAVGELIGKTPIGLAPIIGDIVQVFCSTLVSGLISCSLLIFLDRSKLMNRTIDQLNRIPSEVNNYKELADIFDELVAKLADLDIKKFKEETQKYNEIANKIGASESENEIKGLLLSTYEMIGIKIPWEGEFDSFMGNKSSKLVFG